MDIHSDVIQKFVAATRTHFRSWVVFFQSRTGKRTVGIGIIGLAVLVVLGFSYPRTFPTGTIFSIQSGETASYVGDQLKAEGFINSSMVFRFFLFFSGGDRSVRAGDYYFKNPEGSLAIAWRIARGDQQLEQARVFLREGSTRYDMAEELARALPLFDAPAFLVATKNMEGYLFPETYFFFPNTTVDEVVRTLRTTFDTKIAPLRPDILSFGKPLKDVIVMASIVEKEANDEVSRRMVAGILWNRIKIGMPLQADATILYTLPRGKKSVSFDDLKQDSPYNTYRVKGLPPTPIANPGLEAIEDTVKPTKSSYLYYLTGSNGVMHYATTFEEHKRNRELYLR